MIEQEKIVMTQEQVAKQLEESKEVVEILSKRVDTIRNTLIKTECSLIYQTARRNRLEHYLFKLKQKLVKA